MRAGLIVGGALMIIMGLMLIATFICAIIGIIFGLIGMVMIIVGLVASGRPKQVVYQQVVQQPPIPRSMNSNFCSYCGTDNPMDYNFCGQCRESLSLPKDYNK